MPGSLLPPSPAPDAPGSGSVEFILTGTNTANDGKPIGAAVIVDATGTPVSTFGGAGGAGTQYPDGTTSVTPTGTAVLWKDASNVLHVASPANPLPVTGGGGGVQYPDGTTSVTPTATVLLWKDASNVLHVPSPSQPLPVLSQVADGVTPTNKATVAAFHNADNQATSAFSFGLLTGGVAQLKNAAGNLDRQTETGTDGIAALGISTGTQQLSSPFMTTVVASSLSGVQTITPVAMSGTTTRGGAAWSIQVGSTLVVSNVTGAAAEKVVVTATTATTYTALFANPHTANWVINAFVYNQARDATVSDGATGQGLSAGATYLINNSLNAGVGGWEAERSAAGELDGASGVGTAVAVGYEYNGVGYDRERNLNAKGLATGTITTATLGTTSIVLSATPAVAPTVGLQILVTGGTPELLMVSAVAGATITTTTPIANTGHTTVLWDVQAALGPALNGLTGIGIGIEEDVVYDPLTQLFYIERSATQDAVSGQNLPLESIGVYNGTTFDRLKGTSGAANTYITNTTANPVPTNDRQLTAATDVVTTVGTPSLSIQMALATTVNTYASGNAIGSAVLTLTNVGRINGGTGVIQSVTVMDTTHQNAPIDLLFFNAAPTATPVDKTLYALSTSDLTKLVAKISIPSSVYTTYSTASAGTLTGIGAVFACGGSTTSLFVVAVVQGVPVYTANCVEISLGLLRD